MADADHGCGKAAAGSAIDHAVLDQLLEDVGLENAEMILEAFVEELAKQTQVMDAAVAATDLESVARSAHQLKSSAASFGATSLSVVTASIEAAAKAGDVEATLGQIPELRALAEAALAAMRRFLASGQLGTDD